MPYSCSCIVSVTNFHLICTLHILLVAPGGAQSSCCWRCAPPCAGTPAPDMFKVSGYNTDASGLIDENTFASGIFGSVDNPIDIEISKVSVNEDGNIVLDLKTQKAVLNYTFSRNLTTNIRYSIADTTLPVISETSNSTVSQDTVTSVKTGDDINIYVIGSMMIISLSIIVTINKKAHN